ncbi:xanthine dehydrogenase family protein subunit M [uncultured Mucilaginibacter sp.]|uniref:FAD binding domain-containing protein n=1 Tax=uncultured Mucilaginibacter sp. TaxID=797541 RepID=UPI002627B53B|nr:xanthine dehydrogenase family protein subunit M [uncultured Mucilaginibacter sp.]
MNQFQYVRATTAKTAIGALVKDPSATFLAGGTNLIDLMKNGVTAPQKLIDINPIPLTEIRKQSNSIYIGALATNTDVADHKLVLQNQPLLSLALNAGASAQLRNVATIGGNMMQRTRCFYFNNPDLPCNKRQPGSGCGALEGYNRMHAIFGASPQCVAVNPSDMSVALAALDATVLISGPKGDRRILFTDFHRLPGDHPEKDNNLMKGELITGIEIPDNAFGKTVHYLKVRDRSSYAFALVSVAAALNIKNNTIKEARLAMGGVAHKPWRLTEAEKALVGKPATEATFKQAAEIAMQGAKGLKYNSFKLKMAPNTIIEALKTASGIA